MTLDEFQSQLSDTISEKDHAAADTCIADLEIKIGDLQRHAREKGVPIIIVIEGWDAAGKGTLINKLIQCLDPRGISVHHTVASLLEEQQHPWLWRFWNRTPEKGRIAIFDRSWYHRVLRERVEKMVKKDIWQAAYRDITSFEKELTDDGAVIIKFFLHISKKEQKARFKKLLRHADTAWRVTNDDWVHHDHYSRYQDAVDQVFEKTDHSYAPWHIIDARNKTIAVCNLYSIVAEAIGSKLTSLDKPSKKKASAQRYTLPKKLPLSTADLSLSMERPDYELQLDFCKKRLRELEHRIFLKRIPVIICFEGSDAAGKGGVIKRLTSALDPRGYEVVPIAAPSTLEKSHHYLWRFWQRIPKAGHLTVFDRTWYGRVMVERIEGFCAPQDWQRAYGEIRQFEKNFTDAGGVLIKFWLCISPEMQLRRFQERQSTPWKQWKITDEDWRNREKWPQYEKAVNEMIDRTHCPTAPWIIVPANCKLHARITVCTTVIDRIEKAL